MQLAPPFPYQDAQQESIPCNMCGEKENFKIISTKDRNGLEVRACLCENCGLIFINPRMTKIWYDNYYRTEYRAQVHRLGIKESTLDLDEAFRRGMRAGLGLYTVFSRYIRPGVTIDVGSGVGGILKSFQNMNPQLTVYGVEPSTAEAEYANEKGVPTLNCLLEDLEGRVPRAANIMSTRNLNHLLDPKSFLIWVHHQLEDNGSLILTVQNFRHTSKERGRIISQIDHCFYFTPETLVPFVQSAGFEILHFSNPEDSSILKNHQDNINGLGSNMKVAARKTPRKPFAHINIPKNNGIIIERSFNFLKLKSYQLRYLIIHLLRKMFSHASIPPLKVSPR